MERYVYFFVMELQRRLKLYQGQKKAMVDPVTGLARRPKNFRTLPLFEKLEINMPGVMFCTGRLGQGFDALDCYFSDFRYYGCDKLIQNQIARAIMSAAIFGFNQLQDSRMASYFRELSEALHEVEDSVSMEDVIFSMSELQEVIDDYDYLLGGIAKRYYHGLEDLL